MKWSVLNSDNKLSVPLTQLLQELLPGLVTAPVTHSETQDLHRVLPRVDETKSTALPYKFRGL